jgi:ribosome-associated protein
MTARRKAAKPAVKSPKPKKPLRAPAKQLRRPDSRSKRAKLLAPRGDGIASTSEVVATLSDAEAADLARRCRDAALEKKAERVLILDIRDRAGFADYFVLATGRSVIQARSIADAVVEESETETGAPLRTEGYNDGTWILVDYGAVIVHVFTPQAREFYNLERLWGKPPPPSKRKP